MGLWHKYAFLSYIAVFVAVTGHASSEFVSVLCRVSGPELSVWRFLLGSAGLIILSLFLPSTRNLLEPLRQEAIKLILLSFWGVSFCYLMFHWSLDYATVPQVATTVTMVPIFVGLLNLWINRQPFTPAKILTGLCALVGVSLLITDGYLAKLATSTNNLTGMAMALACTISMSGYLVVVRPIIVRYGALRITTLTLTIGALGLWAGVGIFFGRWVNPLTLFQRPPGQITALLSLGIWNTTITQFLWIGGLAAVPDQTRGSYLFYLKPVIAACLAVFILNQTITPWGILAIMVICGSVLMEPLLSRLGAGKSA
ncbi:MAG: EamA family transporter [Deltaproteobacteria bacterium]|nr:EamA family transporter [Deltaproteobacteria bacterium]